MSGVQLPSGPPERIYPNRIYHIGLDGFGFLLIFDDELYEKMVRGLPRLDEPFAFNEERHQEPLNQKHNVAKHVGERGGIDYNYSDYKSS